MKSEQVTVINMLQDEWGPGTAVDGLRPLLQIDYALSIIEPGRKYSCDFVRDVLAGKKSIRAAGDPDRLLDGKAIISALVVVAAELSRQMSLCASNCAEPLANTADLARRFNVCTKTIRRWRQRGLVAWHFGGPDTPGDVLFPEHCVRQFIMRNPGLVRAAGRFSRVSAFERKTLVRRVRELAAAGSQTAHAICAKIAGETGRSLETVRQVLKSCEQDRSAGHGSAGDAHSERTRARSTREAARELKEREFKFTFNAEFKAPDADDRILSEPPADVEFGGPVATRARTNLSASLLTPQDERLLFRKMNYLRYKARGLVERLAPATATADEIQAITELLDQAEQIRNRIVQANVRLVVSIANRKRRPGQDLFELISDGNMALMRAVDNFDYGRGFKFSTYATWAVINCFSRAGRKPRLRMQTNRENLGEVIDAHPSTEGGPDQCRTARRMVERMLTRLDARERIILSEHYGLAGCDEPQSLADIGRKLSLSKERIRQLQNRAILQLQSEFRCEMAAAL